MLRIRGEELETLNRPWSSTSEMSINFLVSLQTNLRARGLWTSIVEERLLEFDRLCLSQLRDDTLRDVVTSFLAECVPCDFYLAPASSSGNNHPSWQKGPCGILLNTVECCVGIDRKMRIYPKLTDSSGNPSSKERDVIYAATMLSDTFKPEDYGKQWSQWNHHQRAAEEFQRFAFDHGLEESWIQPITEAIFWHLGRFTPNHEGKILDPHLTFSLTSFITHELDMDFSNRSLDEIFVRRGTSQNELNSASASQFVSQELASTTTYFSQVETKMVSIVTLYSTLVVAVVPGAAYIVTNQNLQQLMVLHVVSGKLVVLAGFLTLFSLITTFLLAVYTELRVRKIAMLEAMAAAREFLMRSTATSTVDLNAAIRTVVGIQKCPKFLRRPSEDWYMLCLMSALGGLFWASALFSTVVGVAPLHLQGYGAFWRLLWALSLVVMGIVTYWHLCWVVRFCFEMDLRREARFGPGCYDFLSGKSNTIPLILRPLDRICAWIEGRYLKSSQG
jgi:hypothetical protein